MTHRNWTSANARRRMARQGTEQWNGDPPLPRPSVSRHPRPPAVRKADLRALADAAVATRAGTVTQLAAPVRVSCCGCGHSGSARVRPGTSPRFRCSKCGTLNGPADAR